MSVPGSGYDTNMYTTVEPTLSSNPNVFFHRGVHPGMMYWPQTFPFSAGLQIAMSQEVG